MSLKRREKLFRLMERMLLPLATRRWALWGTGNTYQPLFGLPEGGESRGQGTVDRLKAICEYLEADGITVASSLDVGSNMGYFSIPMVRRGAIAYAVEGDSLLLRVTRILSERLKETVGVLVPIHLWCDNHNVHQLPSVTVTMCLSIWHHWVREFGLDVATEMLQSLWGKTSHVLFFDTGETEMPERYGLPFRDTDSRVWLEDYLSKLPGQPTVSRLGSFAAFAPGNAPNQRIPTMRNLFVVRRTDATNDR